ncbi:MAG TPA: ribokinase [Acetobacteraceae bacterium]
MVVVFGSINLDLIFPLAALPAAGETVLAPDIRMEPGGKGANQALAAARDGARVVLAGAVGRDNLAADALALLRTEGVDLSRVITTARTTGCAAIFVDRQGRNMIGVGSGANLTVRAAQVEDALLTSAMTLVLQMEVAGEETAALIRRARARDARIVLNLAPAAPIGTDALRMVDLLCLNEVEAAWLAGTLGCAPAAEGLHAALGVTVVRTLGAQGAEAAHPGGLLLVPAHPVDAVDTTGAGDCFTGVLASGLDRGLALGPALARASAAAALCCTRAGSQATMPGSAQTDAMLAGPGTALPWH